MMITDFYQNKPHYVSLQEWHDEIFTILLAMRKNTAERTKLESMLWCLKEKVNKFSEENFGEVKIPSDGL